MISLDTISTDPSLSTPRIWSPLQNQVFVAVQENLDNILIQAVAGSGKTTTITEAIKFASGSSLFMAFNKSIAEDIRGKTYCDVKTLNALGHRLLCQYRPRATLDDKKSLKILKGLMSEDDFSEFGYVLKQVIGLTKNQGFDIKQEADLIDFLGLVEAQQIPEDRIEQMAEIASQAFTFSKADETTFDYDDQLWIPLKEGWPYPRYDNVFIDECQDLSPIQHLMLERFQQQGSRIIAVGDRHQAIYGFRGAMSNSMDALKDRFQMLELPLSISYRCDQEIVREAQRFCPHIQARADASLGRVHKLDWDRKDPQLFSDCLIVCRNNAPLFRVILRHIRARQPCRILSSFLDGFSAQIKRFKAQNIPTLLLRLDAWYEKERSAAAEKGQKGKLASLRDRYETIKCLAEAFPTIEDMMYWVRKLSESTTGPIFATIHKAKGLEHERVHILRPDLLPAFYAVTPEQRQQEANLEYVAITRAKHELTFGEKS